MQSDNLSDIRQRARIESAVNRAVNNQIRYTEMWQNLALSLAEATGELLNLVAELQGKLDALGGN